MIRIENKPFSITNYFSGNYILENKEYIFTLIEDENDISVTWVDEVPVNSDNIERDIIKIFQNR